MTEQVRNRWRRPILVALLAATAALGARDLGDEAAVMLTGDMARYVMNAVFVHDAIEDGAIWSLPALTSYAELYFARYPALSLGHHPPIPFLTVVPFFELFGISLTVARLAAIAWFVLAAWGVYAVGRRLFTWQAASWATALFISNLVVLRAGQYLLSEMPMVALVIWSVHALLVFCDTRRPFWFIWFATLAMASLYAKQLAVLMLPVHLTILVVRFGLRSLLSRRNLMAAGLLAALSVPLALMTVMLAPNSVNLAIWNASRLFSGREVGAGEIVGTILMAHLSWPALAAVAAGATWLLWQRAWQGVVAICWAATVIGGSVVFAGTIEPARYAFGALPAYCLLAAGLAWGASAARSRAAVAALLSAVVLWQAWTIRDTRPSGAGGYEEAAQYVIARARQPIVLYDSTLDTGYFVFFVRKHDPAGRLAILRGDKVFRTAALDEPRTPDEILPVLQEFGVQFIVVEEGDRRASILRTLQHTLRTGPFAERHRIPIANNAVQDRHLVIYEFLDARPGNPDAPIDIGIPLGERQITVTLKDLLEPRRH